MQDVLRLKVRVRDFTGNAEISELNYESGRSGVKPVPAVFFVVLTSAKRYSSKPALMIAPCRK